MPDIDLQNLLAVYNTKLCNRLFRYELSNGTTVEVVFYREQLCHLLGLQYVYDHDKHYLGASGYQKIQNGAITADSLQAHNKKQFNYIKDRLLSFSDLPDLMANGELFRFYPDRTVPATKIIAEYLIKRKNKTYILHLFLRKESGTDQRNRYAPISFVTKSETDKNKAQYYASQEYKKIVKREIIETNASASFSDSE